MVAGAGTDNAEAVVEVGEDNSANSIRTNSLDTVVADVAAAVTADFVAVVVVEEAAQNKMAIVERNLRAIDNADSVNKAAPISQASQYRF